MKSPLALLAIVLLSVDLGACGGAGKGTRSTPTAPSVAATGNTPAKQPFSTTSAGGPKDLSDGDNDARDNDDVGLVQYGNAASPTDKLAVTAFVERYFQAAAAADGATLCSLMVSGLAAALAKELSKLSRPSYMRGKTCAQIMSKLYRYRHPQFATEAARFELAGVRVNGNKAYALLAFMGITERRFIPLEREGGTWKMKPIELADSEYP
jgi:hypothetical protein